MRKATVKRVTKETQITASLVIEGKGRYDIETGIRFLDHMLELFAKHGGFDLTVRAVGDLISISTTPSKILGLCWVSCSKKHWVKRLGSIALDTSCCPWMKLLRLPQLI